MKTKTVFLIIFCLSLLGCSNKSEIKKYALLEMQYKTLAGNAGFVVKDQTTLLETGLVSIFDTPEPKFREATQDDKLKAIGLCYEMETLQKFLNECAENCSELRKQYKGKNIINSNKRNPMIKMYSEFIKITEKSMLEITGGINPKTYINQYVPKDLKDLTEL